jgi:hypothetical protein
MIKAILTYTDLNEIKVILSYTDLSEFLKEINSYSKI